jgi:hypothetical protein
MRVVIAVTLAAALSGLAACGKRAETVESVVVPEPAASVAAVELPITQEQALAAMLRGHPNARRICIDGYRTDAFFLDYGPLLPAGAEPDGLWHGWIFIDEIHFYRTSNNTFFVTDQGDEKYAQVYPDVTGLVCKDK